jgi:hypothetical protein
VVWPCRRQLPELEHRVVFTTPFVLAAICFGEIKAHIATPILGLASVFSPTLNAEVFLFAGINLVAYQAIRVS